MDRRRGKREEGRRERWEDGNQARREKEEGRGKKEIVEEERELDGGTNRRKEGRMRK